PQLRDQALMFEARAFKELKQLDRAAAALEKLVLPEIKSSVGAQGALTLVSIYSELHQTPKAVAVLQQLQRKMDLVENVVQLNSMAVQLGDDFLKAKAYPEALATYRVVRSRDDVIKI